MRVLLAFDKFKEALSAPGACTAAARALQELHPGWQLDACPLADGGDGFAEILTTACGGLLEHIDVEDPRGNPVRAAFGLVPVSRIPPAALSLLSPDTNPGTGGQIAVVEMAQASGLALLPAGQRDPWAASTRGTGELIRAAANTGASLIVVGVGGSATNDLGLGALSALGIEFTDAHSKPIGSPIPGRWHDVHRIAGSLRAGLPPIVVACDVTAPLIGTGGAASQFGVQKGLLPADIARMDNACARMALMLCTHFGRDDALIDHPGAGAAGGLPFGLMAATGARITPGAALVAAWLDLDRRIAGADLVITGEGRFDPGTLTGKGPGAVIERALRAGKPVHVFAGSMAAPVPNGCRVHAITPAGTALADALPATAANLGTAIRQAFGLNH